MTTRPLTAGAELDMLIHLEVMKLPLRGLNDPCPDCDQHIRDHPPNWKYTKDYSTAYAGVGTIIERMLWDGWRVGITNETYREADAYHVTFQRAGIGVRQIAGFLPTAVALSALAAVRAQA